MADFEYLKNFINKECKLKCKSSFKEYSGWVYTVDPVSLSVVIVELDENTSKAIKAHVIMNDDIGQIEVLNNDAKLCENLFNKELFYPNSDLINSESEVNLDEKRRNLINWLLKNRIPVNSSNDDDDLINIMDTVFIHKPFNVETCESTNEIILNKIINLVKQFHNNNNNKSM